MCACVCVHTCVRAFMQVHVVYRRQVLVVLSFPNVSSRDWTQVVRLCGKHLCLLCHLASSFPILLYTVVLMSFVKNI